MTFATTSELLPHQADAVAKLLPSRVGGLFAEMGTGKSRILIELARIRAAKGKIDRVVWFCPVSLKETVRHEILKHTDASPEDIHVFGDKTTERSIPPVFWHVVGIESLAQSRRVMLAVNALVTENTFSAVDESTYIKGPRAKRTVRVTEICKRCRYRMVLTGTPFSQGEVDLYGQMTFLSPKILGYNSFGSFAANHIEWEQRRTRGHGRIPVFGGRIVRIHNKDYLAAKIAPYIYQIRKDECLDLPPKIYLKRRFPLSVETFDAYQLAKEEILKLYEDDSGIAIFHLFTVLQTIACGFRKIGDDVRRYGDERLETLLATVGEIADDEKIVIWAKYREAVDQIVGALSDYYGPDTVQQFHGGLSEAARAAELARWRADGRFLVATQQAGGYGLTLTEARYAIFYANGFKASERMQAEDRTHRIGQTRKAVYIDIISDAKIEALIDGALSSKEGALAAFKRRVQVHRKDGLKNRIRAAIAAL